MDLVELINCVLFLLDVKTNVKWNHNRHKQQAFSSALWKYIFNETSNSDEWWKFSNEKLRIYYFPHHHIHKPDQALNSTLWTFRTTHKLIFTQSSPRRFLMYLYRLHTANDDERRERNENVIENSRKPNLHMFTSHL